MTLSLPGYQIGDPIYAGERTLVYQGIRLHDSLKVAIKFLRNEYPSFSELLQFYNQYTIAKNLNLSGIVVPLSLELYGNGYALVMEDLGAISLDKAIQNHHSFTLENSLQIAIQLADILQELDRNRVIHKDIKPANILIQPETQEVKLIDFSIASLLPREAQEIKNFNILEGTLAYISPEQTGRMNRGIDYRSDFYSLGVTLYQLLTGILPFSSDDPMELVHGHISQQPIPPAEVKNKKSNIEIPPIVSDIVMKLMAKNAEDRYQSALGLKFDLEQCLQQWQETGKIEPFELATRDITGRFLIPEKLYGRETEIQTLLAAFERVAEGNTEMMLVAGFSGIGKTAAINEVHKPIVRERGYFIKGKFDQFQRNIPFSAFVIAFRDLMQQLLGESDAQLAQWKDKIIAALGENGQVIIEVIPELESIIGQQPPVPELSGSASQNRFNLLFEKFIQVFTTPEHPLVVFLDDLQWADSASLKLLQLLMSENKTGYLLLLGAYRDNEVSPAHPLMLTLNEMGKSGAKMNTITLAPLSKTDLNSWVADTLSCTPELAWSLSELIYQKTKGNPFFTTQFLKGLHEEGCIGFDRDLGYWHCDLSQVRQLALTEDVVEFMATRLHKLPKDTQESLKLAACMGNQFDLQTLAIVSQQSQTEVATALWKALQEGFVLPLGQTYKFFQDSPLERGTKAKVKADDISVGYKFVHDRIQQAAYSLIPEDQRQVTHYHIGQLLLQEIRPEVREDRIFELINQLNYGTALITEQQERDELAQLNLVACRKARAATAYQAGRDYARTGLLLLGENPWQRQYQISLEFHELAAELASLCGDFEAMEQLVEMVIKQAESVLDRVNVYRIRIQGNIAQNQLTEAITIALQVLQQFDTPLPEKPTDEDIQEAIAEIGQLLGDREIEDLIHLPEMRDREKMAIVQIANSIIPVAYIAAPPFFPILICLSVKLSIQYGNTLASGFGYVCYGTIACNLLKDVSAGVKFGHLALELVSQLDAKAIKPEVTNAAGLFILHRQSHIKNVLALLQESYRSALEVGNQELAGYCAQNVCLNSFWCSQSLSALEQQTRVYCQGLMQLNQVTTANYCRIYWQSILNLQGLEECPSILSGKALVEAEFLPVLTAAHDWFGLYLFHLYKLMLSYFFGEIESAQEQAVTTRQYLIAGVGMVSEPAFYFYDALTILADSTGESEALERVEENRTQLQEQWARHAPMNHQHKVDLIAAEKARVLGNRAEAIALYDRAITGAKENEFLQEEALANELAAKFYLDWGKAKIAQVYMTDAYYGYARWGAKAKTDQLERQYPQLLSAIVQPPSLQLISGQTVTSNLRRTVSSSSSSTGFMLDWATAMKAAQSLSSEIHLDKLVSTLMKAAMENAGADRAILLLNQQDSWQVVARYALQMGQLHSMPTEEDIALPTSVINKVKRSQQPIIVNDVSREPQLAGDPYLLQEPPKSLLCAPILNQGNPIGILYLENHLAVGVFTGDRIELLNLLCSQAAISLENARLYEQSQDYAQKLEQSLKDLQQAQLQLVQNEKMSALGNLVAGVAHEINNPVAFIAGNINPARESLEDLFGLIDLYQQEYPEPSEAIEAEIEAIDLEFLREDLPNLIASMREGTDRIGHISDSLRTFSRADKDYKVPFNLHQGIDSTLLILKHRLKANEERPAIEIIKDYGDLPEVQCFPGQMNQVFMNLIANAIDALEEANQGLSFEEIAASPNRIIIQTSATGQDVTIRIADNGTGMSEEVQERIFEQGFTTKAVGKGTGLGMAIAHQIVTEKHGGKITCTSERGKGTEFTIWLCV